MGVRYTVSHSTHRNLDIRVDIEDALFSGTSAVMEGTGRGWLNYSHQRLDPSSYTEIQQGDLSMTVWINTSAEETFRNDVLTSSEGRFQLKLYFDDVLEWVGDILPDLCSYTENVPEKLTLKARDFTTLKKDLFALSDTRETIITTIEDILSSFSLPIITATSWTESNKTSTNDFLRQIYHDRTALRQFTDADNDDINITNEEALRWILRGYGLTLKQSGGALRIDQFTEYEDPSTVLLSTYNSGFQSQAETDVTQTATVTIESDNKPNAGIKRVENTFAHRTQSSIGGFPSLIRIENNDTRTISQAVVGFGFPISVQGDIEAIVRTSDDLGSKGITYIRLTAGQYHYVNGKWDDTVDFLDRFNLINLTRETKTAVPFTSNFDYRYIGDFSISTVDIPSDATAGVEVEFRGARLGVSSIGESGVSVIDFKTEGSAQSDECNFTNVRFEASFEEGDSQSIIYELRNADNFTLEIDYPTTYYGDGPNESSPSALRFDTAFDDLTSSGWQRRGGGSVRPFHTNLLHEILDPRRGARRVLNGVIKSDFVPHKVLSYDSAYFYYLGGTFDGYTGNWSVQVVEISITDNEEVITKLLTDRIQSFTNNSARVIDLTIRDLRKLLLLAGVVGVTTTEYDGTENNGNGSVEVDLDLSQPLRAGFEYWIINSKELSGSDVYEGIYPINPDLENYSQTGEVTVPIEPQQIINAPKGSILILAPSQSATNQIVFEDSKEFLTDQVAVNTSAITTISTVIDVELGDIVSISESLTELQTTVDLFEDDIAINSGAITTLQTRVTVTEGDISSNSTAVTAVQAGIGSIENEIDGSFETFDDSSGIWNTFDEFFLNGIPVNAKGVFFLDARVTETDTEQTSQATAILGVESDITGIETNYRSFIYQGTPPPALRPDESALQTGDVWINTTDGENIQSVWNGTAWVRSNADFDARISTNASATLTLESEVDVIDGRVTKVSAKAALVVDAGGTIGSISLEADGLTGFSEIDIKASQVTINGVLFDDDGNIRSTNFNGTFDSGAIDTYGTTGWAIDRAGTAVFNDVAIRNGEIDATTLVNLNILGTLTIGAGGSIVGNNFEFTQGVGTISGWIIDENVLKSQASNRRIELNKEKNRVSIFGTDTEDAVMGYLAGLPRNQDTSTFWASNNYGFWARQGTDLVIDGDIEYDSGDWLIQSDAAIRMLDQTSPIKNEVLRVGNLGGALGFYMFAKDGVNPEDRQDTGSGTEVLTGTVISAFTSEGFLIGNKSGGNYIEYIQSTGVLDLRGTLNADDINAGTLNVDRLEIDDLLAEDATITGTLTMGANGEITKAGGDFTLDSDGLNLASGKTTFERSTAITWDTKADISYLTNIGLQHRSDQHIFSPEGGGDAMLVISFDGFDVPTVQVNTPLQLNLYTTTQMNAITNPKSGWVIWNDTEERVAFYTGTQWRFVQSFT